MAAQGIATLVQHIRIAPIEPGMPVPPVLIVCPPRIEQPRGFIAPKFRGAETRCGGMPEAYREMASSLGCHFFDANSVISVSQVDGIHLDAGQHARLGESLVAVVRPLFD
jgi:lysophospholipase L1-like esterase